MNYEDINEKTVVRHVFLGDDFILHNLEIKLKANIINSWILYINS